LTEQSDEYRPGLNAASGVQLAELTEPRASPVDYAPRIETGGGDL
jgi:hypothetical protein